jgi:hypothetical protein
MSARAVEPGQNPAPRSPVNKRPFAMSSEKIRHPAETVRRTRGKAANGRAETPETRANGSVAARAGASLRGSRAAKKANGHANGSANHAAAAAGANGAAFRANGHGRAFESVHPAAAPLMLPDAASDGARVNPDAAAAYPAAAGMVRDAHAEVAEGGNGASGTPAANGRMRIPMQNWEQTLSEGAAPRVPSETMQRGAGETPLPDDPADFVQEIHSRIDLFELWIGKLTSEDEKISQRALEKLTDMLYKGAAPLGDQPQPIVIDIDSAVARRAREAAEQESLEQGTTEQGAIE